MNETPKTDSAQAGASDTSYDRHRASKAAKEAAKQARLKAALRDNLRRRKASDHNGKADGA
jgi:hypothetical protein